MRLGGDPSQNWRNHLEFVRHCKYLGFPLKIVRPALPSQFGRCEYGPLIIRDMDQTLLCSHGFLLLSWALSSHGELYREKSPTAITKFVFPASFSLLKHTTSKGCFIFSCIARNTLRLQPVTSYSQHKVLFFLYFRCPSQIYLNYMFEKVILAHQETYWRYTYSQSVFLTRYRWSQFWCARKVQRDYSQSSTTHFLRCLAYPTA